MSWVWNASLPAWTTQVSLSGKFVMTRDEVVDGVLVSLVWLLGCCFWVSDSQLVSCSSVAWVFG